MSSGKTPAKEDMRRFIVDTIQSKQDMDNNQECDVCDVFKEQEYIMCPKCGKQLKEKPFDFDKIKRKIETRVVIMQTNGNSAKFEFNKLNELNIKECIFICMDAESKI